MHSFGQLPCPAFGTHLLYGIVQLAGASGCYGVAVDEASFISSWNSSTSTKFNQPVIYTRKCQSCICSPHAEKCLVMQLANADVHLLQDSGEPYMKIPVNHIKCATVHRCVSLCSWWIFLSSSRCNQSAMSESAHVWQWGGNPLSRLARLAVA